MTETAQLPAAIAPDALYSKSQLFVRRALASRAATDFREYRLWASFTLELLAKAALSTRHPSLIVAVKDGGRDNSLLVAAGISVEPHVATIGAELAYTRMKHLAAPQFSDRIFRACKRLADSRNAFLHSGEMPPDATADGVWEGDFWFAAELMLKTMDQDVAAWIGVEGAEVSKQILAQARAAKKQATTAKVAEFTLRFKDQYKNSKSQKLAIEQSAQISPYDTAQDFRRSCDGYWTHVCPACGGMAVLGGDHYDTVFADDQAGVEPGFERIEKAFIADEFLCPTCGLRLHGDDEIFFAGIETTHSLQEDREAEWEPEYGND